MRRCAVLVLLALIATLLPAARPAAGAPAPEAVEAEFVARINALRTSKGLRPLQVHPELVAVGRDWAARMAAAGRISHRPDLADVVKADWHKLGENVGVGATVEALHDAFVKSPSHYRNLVDPTFTFIGVGVVATPDGTIYTAHQFMVLRSAAKPAPRPAPAAASRATPAPTTTAPPPPPPPPAPREAPARLVLVLDRLAALDASA